MGYSHYWNRPQIIDLTTFNTISKDLSALLPALEAAGALLANAYGREEPEIGPEFIGFNGVECCGHAKNQDVRLAWPSKDAHGIGDNMSKGGTLPYRTCNGDCSFESVWFERVATIAGEDGRVECSCKTAFRPYDLAVTAFLVIAKHRLRGELQVQTDGEPCHWAEAFALCQAKLGYGGDYSFQNDRLVSHEEALCG